MAELFRKLEFRALLKRMDELEEALPGAAPLPAENSAHGPREPAASELAVISGGGSRAGR